MNKQMTKRFTREERIAYYTDMLEKACRGLNQNEVDPRDIIAEWTGTKAVQEAESLFLLTEKVKILTEELLKIKKGA